MHLTAEEVLDRTINECIAELIMIKDNQIAEHQRAKANEQEMKALSNRK